MVLEGGEGTGVNAEADFGGPMGVVVVWNQMKDSCMDF